MSLRRILPLLTASSALSLAGCDNFSLKDLLYLPGEGILSLTAASTTTTRNGNAVALTVTGGTAPYDISQPVEVDRYSGTPSASYTFGAVVNQTYQPGGAIGRVRITVTDADGTTSSVEITVVPPPPVISISSIGDIWLDVAISYADRDFIDNFILERTSLGADFAPIATIPSVDTTYKDQPLSSGATYSYRMYAVSGSYHSLYTSVVVAEL